ncbi:hypothetical protein Kisp01_70830 [Kineosporia sp. NBRC 101677]|nr:hypothetical protein Kisp01_70830 [Kineosporia sp. NBRC 101677]
MRVNRVRDGNGLPATRNFNGRRCEGVPGDVWCWPPGTAQLSTASGVRDRPGRPSGRVLIPAWRDLPNVGANLQDHPLLTPVRTVTDGTPLHNALSVLRRCCGANLSRLCLRPELS